MISISALYSPLYALHNNQVETDLVCQHLRKSEFKNKYHFLQCILPCCVSVSCYRQKHRTYRKNKIMGIGVTPAIGTPGVACGSLDKLNIGNVMFIHYCGMSGCGCGPESNAIGLGLSGQGNIDGDSNCFYLTKELREDFDRTSWSQSIKMAAKGRDLIKVSELLKLEESKEKKVPVQALNLAIKKENDEMIKAILVRGIAENSVYEHSIENPLYLAIKYHNDDLANVLVEEDRFSHVGCYSGKSPLDMAIKYKKLTLFKKIALKMYSRNLEDCFSRYSKKNSINVINYFLDLLPNKTEDFLEFAIQIKKPSIVKYIIENSKVPLSDLTKSKKAYSYYFNLLDYEKSKMKEKVEILNLLLLNNFDPSLDGRGWGDLVILSMRTRNYKILKVIVEKAAFPNQVNFKGEVPLLCAIKERDKQAIKIFKDSGKVSFDQKITIECNDKKCDGNHENTYSELERIFGDSNE